MTTFRVTNLDTQEFVDYPDMLAGLRPAGLLPVPYVSQLEEGAKEHHNDCGAGCGVMLIRAYNAQQTVTVDEFYDRCNPQGDVYLSAGQIKSALAAFHINSTWQVGMSLTSLMDTLRMEKPLIALINYGVLVRANLTERKSFRGAHFVVIVGLDNKYVYTHDPYYTKKNGEACLYPIDKFLESWGRCAEQGNPNNAALIPNYSVVDAQQPLPPVLFRVRVNTPGSILNIRSGPGANFLDVGDLAHGTELDVFTEQNGWGEIGVGHWISLAYIDRI